MTRKLIITADLHLTDKAHEQYRHKTMDHMRTIIRDEKPDAFLILGDLTEDKDRHAAWLVNKVVDHLAAFGKLVPTIVMMGNHDYHNEGHPFFAFIQRMEGVHWIDKVTDGRSIGNIFNIDLDDVIFLPHTRTHQSDWEPINWKPYDFAMAHNAFKGAQSANGHTLDGIPLRDIPEHVKIIAGDIHKPQSWDGCTYVGAPYRVDFGDNYAPRLLKLVGSKPWDISLASQPQKQLFVLDEVSDLWNDKYFDRNVVAGDVIKMRIGIDDMGQWHGAHKDARAWCQERGAIAFKIEPVLAKGLVKRRHEAPNMERTSVAGEEDALRMYAKRHDVREDDLREGFDIIKHGEDIKAGLPK